MMAEQMPVMGDPHRVQVKEYPGGHMFYNRAESAESFRKDVRQMYDTH